MKIQHLKSSELKPAAWSGGTTTQLFIYPPDAEYSKRNFLFRISTATTDTEISQFTHLPGISRQLMVLEGELELIHNGGLPRHLRKFYVDAFSGDWKTIGKGKVTDFNLMMREGASGNIMACTLENGENFELSTETEFTACYILTGNVELVAQDQKLLAARGDMVVISEPERTADMVLKANERTEVIFTRVSLQQ